MGGGPIGRGGGWNLSRAMGRRTLSSSSRTGVSSAPSSPSGRKTHHHRKNLASPQSPPHPLSLCTKSANAFISPPNPASRAVGVFPTNTSDPDTGCDGDWVCVDGFEGEDPDDGYYFDDFVLGDVPSKDEVESAVLAVQKAFDPSYYPHVWDGQGFPLQNDVSSVLVLGFPPDRASEVDQNDFKEDHALPTGAIQNYGTERVFDAFDMLRNEPSVQKMVMSLSSDKAIWEAVLNNEVVKELRESYKQENSVLEAAEGTLFPNNTTDSPDRSTAKSNPFMNALLWFFDNTRVKLLQMIENISKIVGQMIHPVGGDGQAKSLYSFEEKLRASFLLSIFVLMVVAVARARRG
ncbi:hypothetical protein MLD38_025621 [Melastoma candidum]|uniref:Uncharacterized protein n=1 Tax=Melastoma candidum TaxID=119954 RepID=A0ACB9NZ23_9MYRT|nr:hypothetical protein MLD38_025621 [Melastoma candidum]